MTVICWDGETLASDSLLTQSGSTNKGRIKKIFQLKSGGIVGIAGHPDVRAVINLLDNIKEGHDLPTKAELEATKTDGAYLLILPDKSVWAIDICFNDDMKTFDAAVIQVIEKRFAIGSGEDFAQVALDLGLTAPEAVKVACQYNVCCGGPVQTLTLYQKPREKIKRVRKPKEPEAGE